MERIVGGSAYAAVDQEHYADADEGLMLYTTTLGHTAGNPADSIVPNDSYSMP